MSTTTAFDRRGFLIKLFFGVGLGIPALCWVSVLLGATRETYPHDYVAVSGVLFSVYAPLLAFLNNKGERRTMYQKLVQFAWLWFFANTGYQVMWELPWVILKPTLMYGGVTETAKWLWPWWAYGVADTRYLMHHDLSLSISVMDGSIALLEVFTCYLYLKGYRIKAAWLAMILCACLSWGQFYFYVGEFYNGFANIEDGWFGLWMKYGLLNIPWCVYPFATTLGFIWFLAVSYKKKGVEEYLANNQQLPEFEQSFIGESNMCMTVDNDGNETVPPANDAAIRKWMAIMLATPFIFLIVDLIIWWTVHAPGLPIGE